MNTSVKDRIRTLVAGTTAFIHPRRIGYLIAYVTNRCNLACPFCFYHGEISKGRKSDELSSGELDRIAARLGPLVQLSLTGGEPFLRRDLASITRSFLRHCAPGYVTIPTNGWFTDYIVDVLEDVVPAFPATSFRVVLSIEGVGEEHDQARGAPGAYDRVLATYQALSTMRSRLPNLVLDSNTVLTRRNLDSIVGTLSHLDAEFSFDNLSVTFARGAVKDRSLDPLEAAGHGDAYRRARKILDLRVRARERRFLSALWRAVDDVSYDHFVETVIRGRHVTTCVAGRKLVVLRETGEVHPCEILDRSAGNVRSYHYDLNALLAARPNHDVLDWIRSSRCKCGFECALAANVVWNPIVYPRLLAAVLRNITR